MVIQSQKQIVYTEIWNIEHHAIPNRTGDEGDVSGGRMNCPDTLDIQPLTSSAEACRAVLCGELAPMSEIYCECCDDMPRVVAKKCRYIPLSWSESLFHHLDG
jgi:hypothetical protein